MVTAVAAGRRLEGIEASRGVAASLVVLAHVARHLDRASGAPLMTAAFRFGHAGVDVFFVISGFIILFVHAADVGDARRLAHYAARRATRLLPTYWVALALTVVLAVGGGHGVPSFAALAWSVTLAPSDQPMLLGIAWTLQFEVLFYVLFGVLVANRTAGTLALTMWLASAGLTAMTAWRASWLPDQFAAPFVFEFFLGMAAALTVQRGGVPRPDVFLAAGILLFVTAAVLEDSGLLDGFGAAARLAYGVPSALAVLGIAEADRRDARRVPAMLRALGGASYSIYLFQFVFIGIVWQVMRAARLDQMLPAVVMFAALALAAIGGGVAMSVWVERPLLRVLRPSPRPAHGFE
jgi:peptidoglycan/LPS O-acetylase OafA/YrhL